MKKFELTTEQRTNWLGKTLFRIKACIDFDTISGYKVHAGYLGGYVETENNLSQDGTAWVFGSAEVYGDAKVYGNAEVHGSAMIFGNAEVHGNAEVFDNVWVFDNADIGENAKVFGDAEVCDNARVFW